MIISIESQIPLKNMKSAKSIFKLPIYFIKINGLRSVWGADTRSPPPPPPLQDFPPKYDLDYSNSHYTMNLRVQTGELLTKVLVEVISHNSTSKGQKVACKIDQTQRGHVGQRRGHVTYAVKLSMQALTPKDHVILSMLFKNGNEQNFLAPCMESIHCACTCTQNRKAARLHGHSKD